MNKFLVYKFQKKISSILLLFLILFSLIVIYFHFFLSIKTTYLPVNSDEYLYYMNAKSFFQHSTLKAGFTFNGKGAILLGADSHGFAYPLLHGLIAKLVGWHNYNFIYLNFFLICLMLIIYCNQNFLSIYQKLVISILLLSFPFILIFSVTYMQEIIHIFLAIIVSILIYHIYKTDQKNLYISLLLLTLFFGAFFRSLWLLWVISLFPLVKTKKQVLFFFSLFIFSFIISFAIIYFFDEPVPSYLGDLISKIENFKIKSVIYSLVYHFSENLTYLIIYGFQLPFPTNITYLTLKYSIIGAFLFYLIKCKNSHNPLYYAIALIGAINFILLLFSYSAFDWREIRSLSPFLYFTLLFFVLENKKTLNLILSGIFILSFCFSYFTIKQYVEQRNSLFDKDFVKINQDFNKITEFVTDKRPVLIYIEDRPSDFSVNLLCLPFVSKYGFPIKYIIRYYDTFALGNDYADYILTFSNSNQKNYKNLINNDNYKLFKNF